MNKIEAQIAGRKKLYNKGYGSSHSILGYDEYNLIIKSEAKVVKIIFDLFIDERLSLNKIASKLNENRHFKTKKGGRFSAQLIKRIIQRPEYCGMTYTYDKSTLTLSNIYEPIITLQKWKLAQSIYSIKEKRSKQHNSIVYSISGFPLCSECYSEYYLIKGSYIHSKKECQYSSKSISRMFLDKYINAVFLSIISDPYLCSVIYMNIQKNKILANYFYDLAGELNERINEISDLIEKINRETITSKTKKQLEMLTNGKLMLSNRLNNSDKEDDDGFYACIDYLLREWYSGKKEARLNVCSLVFSDILIHPDKSIAHRVKNWDRIKKSNIECRKFIEKPQIRLHSTSDIINTDSNFQLSSKIAKAIEDDERYYKEMGSIFTTYNLSSYKEELRSIQKSKNGNHVKFFLKDDTLTCVDNTELTLDMSDIYQIDNVGPYYLLFRGQTIKIDVFIKKDEVVCIYIKNKIYFNKRFLNTMYSLCPSRFSKDNKYIKLLKHSLCYYEENNKLKCYNLRSKEDIDINKSILLIRQSSEFKLY